MSLLVVLSEESLPRKLREVSVLSHENERCLSSLLKLRSALVSAVWSERQPLAHGGSILSLLDGLEGCDPGFCIGRVSYDETLSCSSF